MLEPRDQILEHAFDFNWEVDIEDLRDKEMQRNYEQNKALKDLIANIQGFLVESVSNVVSVAFEYLC